jgi:hypothetical protein
MQFIIFFLAVGLSTLLHTMDSSDNYMFENLLTSDDVIGTSEGNIKNQVLEFPSLVLLSLSLLYYFVFGLKGTRFNWAAYHSVPVIFLLFFFFLIFIDFVKIPLGGHLKLIKSD